MRALAPAWQRLAERLETSRHFHRVEWYQALVDTLVAFDDDQTCFFGVFTDELIAVLPFRRTTVQLAGMALRALQLLADPWDAETARDIVLPDAAPNLFGEIVRALAAADPAWDVLFMRGILDDSCAALALKASPDVQLLSTPGGAWGRIEFVSCDDADGLSARLSKSFRQNLRTAHNNLHGRDIQFVAACEPAALAAAYPVFVGIERASWKGGTGTSTDQQPIVDVFTRHLMARFGEQGGCEIHLMTVDDQPMAAMFCVVVSDIAYIFKTCYAEAFQKVSPGHLILERVIRQRGASGRLTAITPYNAPPWFSAWRPDKVSQILNAYVFPPSPEGMRLRSKIMIETMFKRRA